MTDPEYVDDLELLAITPAHAESLLHSLEQATKDFGLYVQEDKKVHILNKIEPSPY